MSFWKIVEPLESTNKVLNPVAGTTGNYAAVGATATRASTYAYFGGYSYRVQSAADNQGITLTLGALANADHYVTLRIRGTLPTAWDWSLDNSNFNAPSLVATEGDWSVYGYLFPAAQANGSTTLRVYQNGAGSGDFYIGHAQVEALGYRTDPITGERPGCEWNGTKHGSTSTRSAQSRAGGVERDFSDTYGFHVEGMIGVGMPDIRLLEQSQALLPGVLDKGEKVDGRTFFLVGEQEGTTWANMHYKRKTLMDVLKSDRVKGKQKFLLRYTGANSSRPAEIQAKYLRGMELSTIRGFTDRKTLAFRAAEPMWYELGENVAHLTLAESVADADYAVKRVDGDWSNVSTNIAGTVYALALDPSKNLYIGGNFYNVGDANGDYIVMVSPDGTMTSLGSGLLSVCYAIAVAPNGYVYAAGDFSLAGGVANTVRIAYWDGSTWNPLSAGINNGSVRALAFDRNGNLYVGGTFTNHIDANGDYISMWNGSTWSSLGSGLNGVCGSIVVGPDGNIYVAGSFTSAGGVANTSGIAMWDGTSWNAVGSGLTTGTTIAALAFAPDGSLYAGGTFTVISGVAANNIAQWNGSRWQALGDGVNTSIYELSVSSSGMVYAGGLFTSAGGLTLADRIAAWNGWTWSHLEINLPGTPTVHAILCDGDDLYIGYSTSGTATASALTTVTNSGTETARPVFTFSRSGGTSAVLEYIKNQTTGETMWCNYALLDGETLVIDLTPGNIGAVSSFFGRVTGQVFLRPSDLAGFALLPGDNDISVFVNQSGSPTMEGYVNWRTTHWMVDGVAAA